MPTPQQAMFMKSRISAAGFGTWTQHSATVHGAWECIASNGSRVVALGGVNTPTSIAMYSDNEGNNWSAGTIGNIGEIHNVIWNPVWSRFVAVASDNSNAGSVLYSADGITWTNVAVGTGRARRIAVNPAGYMVALGWAAGNATWVSNDGGSSWTTYNNIATGPLVPISISWFAPASKFVATQGTVAYSSTDGVTWTNNGAIGFSGGAVRSAVSSSTICAVDNGAPSLGIKSTDGASWSSTFSVGNTNTSAICYTSQIGGFFTTVSEALALGVISVSTDNGATWTPYNMTGTSVNGKWKDICWGGTKLIAIAGTNGGADPAFQTGNATITYA